MIISLFNFVNSDNTFSLAIKHQTTDQRGTNTDWEIINLTNDGVIDWSSSHLSIWTQDISIYENKIFNGDIDGDGSHIGTEVAESPPTFDYLREVVQAAERNGFYSMLMV